MTVYPIYFDVRTVREYLCTNGHVYTLRHSWRKCGLTRAVCHEGEILRDLGQVNVSLAVANVIDYKQLLPYVNESGITIKQDDMIESLLYSIGNKTLQEVKKDNIALIWLKLAQKLSGYELGLFKVELVNKTLNTGLYYST